MAGLPSVSFEFFPPHTPRGEETLWRRVDELSPCNPAFMTVTYGAGGSTRDRTVDLAIALGQRSGRPAAAHLTFIATPQRELKDIADRLWSQGVRHIVALRGDMPQGAGKPESGAGYFAYTSDFVSGLKSWNPFEISVGAYPEKHPDAPDMRADIEALRKKCEAGADRAITQFFFDNEVFYRFRDTVAAAGIHTPVVPGVLPVIDYDKMRRFAATCKAGVPDSIAERFEAVRGDEAATEALALDILIRQVRDLAANGVPHIHFYTLNHSDLPRAACRALGIV